MAERRMFSKTIIDSDAFLDMPLSTQALYFHLSMRADDDGFINNPRKIQRMIGANDDDFKLLIAKRFIILFDSGVIAIKHWKIHNYIRGDRKKQTNYVKEMSLLTEKSNGAYSLKSEEPLFIEEETAETKRQKAYKESSLPYSFEYKIKKAFWGCECPICGAKMQENNEDGIVTKNRIPSIRHNIPISKGGKHELGNISVICKECNITLKDTETESLNAEEVIQKWDEICMPVKCQSSDSQMSVKCQHRLGKVRLGKVSLGKDRCVNNNNIITKEPGGAEKHPHHTHITLSVYDSLCSKYGKAFVDSKADKAYNDKALIKFCEQDYNRKPSSGAGKNKFNKFEQRDYDLNALEERLTSIPPPTAGNDEAIRKKAEELHERLKGEK